jgi:succinate-semialdehyde dehydrogenase/glutarate-semialdehyde dehydrogenase
MKITTTNPFTETEIESYSESLDSEVESTLESSLRAHSIWKSLPIEERVESVLRLEQVLKKNQKNYSLLITNEMGKTLDESNSEISKCANSCLELTNIFNNFVVDEQIETPTHSAQIRIDSIGPVLGIMPWNFPFWQVIRFAVPSILMGNTVILKHSPNVTGCSLALRDLFLEAGFPKGVFQILIMTEDRMPKLILDRRVRALSLTGSTRAGRAVASLAGQGLKKCVLELGGSDPSIVFADCDLEKSVDSIFTSRNLNSGQSCIAAKRAFVSDEIYDSFLELYVSRLEKLKMGSPLLSTTTLAPLARKDLQLEAESKTTELKKIGTVHRPKIPMPETGFFFSPGIAELKSGARYDEEIFAPLLTLSSFNETKTNLTGVAKMANETPFGLGASVYTGDWESKKTLSKELECGSIFVNDFVKSTSSLPFGGVKDSGYGRELSKYSFLEFANIKTVAQKK